jgi:hypothetical protein
MLWRQIRVFWVPFIIFLACAAVAIWNHGTSEGSSGPQCDGRYYLSLGHGAYQEASPERYALIKRKERIVLGCFAGMLVSAIVAGYRVKRAGLPLHKEPIRPT